MVNITETGTNKISGATEGINIISVWVAKITTKSTEIISDFGLMEYIMIISFIIIVIFLIRMNRQIKDMKEGPNNRLRRPYRRGRR